MRKKYRALKRQEAIKRKRLNKMLQDKEDFSYDKTFAYQHFVKSANKSQQGVGWKSSAQIQRMFNVVRLLRAKRSIDKRKLPPHVSGKTQIHYERGKAREITPIHIKNRIDQKVLCDNCLSKILPNYLIYDNGASLEGKGVEFSRERMMHHLVNAIKEFGTDFYILSYDFKDYFNSIPHTTCRRMLEKYILDKDIVDITMEAIKAPYRKRIKEIKDKEERKRQLELLDNDELKGICLGSQVSQIMALIVANDLDHYIKDIKRCKYCIRYMDDGTIIVKTKEEAKELLEGIKTVVNKLGLELSEKKTHITKATKGFTFLKVRYFVCKGSSKIHRKLTRKGITRMRRKMKKFRTKVDNEEMTLDDVYSSVQSWVEHSEVADSYKTRKEMMKLYDKLFGGYKITRKWKREHGGDNVLQIDKWAKYRWCCNAI